MTPKGFHSYPPGHLAFRTQAVPYRHSRPAPEERRKARTARRLVDQLGYHVTLQPAPSRHPSDETGRLTGFSNQDAASCRNRSRLACSTRFGTKCVIVAFVNGA